MSHIVGFKGSPAARNFCPRIPLMQNFFEIFQKKSIRHKFYENRVKRIDSKVMKHVIFSKTDFKVSLIKPRSRVWCVQKTDDVMSDYVIIDYIITKNGEMTLLVYVSPFKG